MTEMEDAIAVFVKHSGITVKAFAEAIYAAISGKMK